MTRCDLLNMYNKAAGATMRCPMSVDRCARDCADGERYGGDEWRFLIMRESLAKIVAIN